MDVTRPGLGAFPTTTMALVFPNNKNVARFLLPLNIGMCYFAREKKPTKNTPTQPTPRSPPSQPVRHSSDSSSRRRVANPSQCNSCQLQVGLPPLATTLSPTLQLLRSPPLSSERLVTRKPLLQTLFFPSCHRPLPPPLLFQQKKTNLHHPRLDHGRSGLALSSNPRPLPKKT
jgi:hypothetical protein